MDQQKLFNKLFSRDEDDTDHLSFLKDQVRTHPAFGAAHYFLAKHSTNDDDSGRAALFFNDAFLLHERITEKEENFQPAYLQDPVVTEEPGISAPEKAPTITEITSSSEAITEMPPADEPIFFEPLHTTDYFASQGIKLSEEMPGNDKLSKQLKSFTSWLKTMKKIHPDRDSEATGETDRVVQLHAEQSNADSQILTEAMAEAYFIQGKTLKAIDVYTKLSLQNPSKSAYFAAKIESLKS